MSKKIKAVIFDMDGVLIDARDWHYESLNKALGLFGSEISRYDHLVTFDGLPTKKKLEMLSLEGRLPLKLHDFINDLKQEYTWELVYSKCKPIFQHQFALSNLKNEGLKIAVCSNSIRKTIELMMDKSGLHQYLDFFLSNQIETTYTIQGLHMKLFTNLTQNKLKESFMVSFYSRKTNKMLFIVK